MTRHSWLPGTAPAKGRSNSRTLNAIAYSHFIEMLMTAKGGASRPQLVAKSGMREALISRLITALRARGACEGRPGYNRICHIAGWHLDARGYATLAAYSLGPGVDMPKPKKSRDEIVRDYLQRRAQREALAAKADGEK